MTQIVVGIDIGVRRLAVAFTAIGVLMPPETVVIESNTQDLNEAWLFLYDRLAGLIRDLPYLSSINVYVEEPPFVRNHRTMLHLSAVYGFVSVLCLHLSCGVLGVPVSEWKKATVGKGNATKVDVMAWATTMYADREPMSQDEADALAIMYYGIQHTNTEAVVNREFPM